MVTWTPPSHVPWTERQTDMTENIGPLCTGTEPVVILVAKTRDLFKNVHLRIPLPVLTSGGY